MVTKSETAVPKLGARNTRQRTAVVSVLRDMDYFASAKKIHEELTRRDYKVGLTTVYRTLQSLSDIDAVDVLHMSSGIPLPRMRHGNPPPSPCVHRMRPHRGNRRRPRRTLGPRSSPQARIHPHRPHRRGVRALQ